MENEKNNCEFCNGTGVVDTYAFSSTGEEEIIGEEKCICQLPDEYDETPEE